MRRNANLFTSKPMGAATDLYNTLRTEIARILAQLHALNQMDEDSRDSAWLEEELAKIKKAKNASTQLVEAHIRAGDLEMQSATSFLNDSDYAYNAMKDLLKAAKAIYSEPESTEEQVERILKSDESGPQLGKIMAEQERDGEFDVHPV